MAFLHARLARALLPAAYLAALVVAPRAEAATAPADIFLRDLRTFMTALRPESVADAGRIEEAYTTGAPVPMIADRDARAAAIAGGRIARLPAHASVYNLRPRLRGAHPLGQLDLAHQHLYVAAHPAALGCLLQVAARVRSAPLDVTSLVRHRAYQAHLQRSNPNAHTRLPVHTLGLAFDISVLNVPIRTAVEIRDVLRAMRDAGDLYFVAETRQLVFHVVPTPQRLAFFADLFHGLASLPAPPPAPALPPRNLLAEASLDAATSEEPSPWVWALTSVLSAWR
jgi:hypothetical protein